MAPHLRGSVGSVCRCRCSLPSPPRGAVSDSWMNPRQRRPTPSCTRIFAYHQTIRVLTAVAPAFGGRAILCPPAKVFISTMTGNVVLGSYYTAGGSRFVSNYAVALGAIVLGLVRASVLHRPKRWTTPRSCASAFRASAAGRPCRAEMPHRGVRCPHRSARDRRQPRSPRHGRAWRPSG